MRSDRNVLAGLVAMAVIVFGVAVRLRLTGFPQGDEPHYLALAQAIVKYHTFDPTPVYAHRDYWPYYPAEIDAHVAVVDGRPVPFHNVGVALLLALPFLVWGRAGAQLVMLLAAVLTVVNVYRLQRELGIRTGYAGFVTGAFVLGSPLYVYASMLFVEPIGMLLVVFAVRVILADQVTGRRMLLASAGVGFLPWIHGRYAIFPVTLGALIAVRLVNQVGRRSARPYLRGLLPLALLSVGLEVFNLARYRSLSPAPGTTDALGEGLLQLAPHLGLVFLAFDARFGLLTNFLMLGLAIAGIVLSLNRDHHRRVNLVLLGAIVPYVVAVATYPNWPGGYTPPGRLLAITTPLLAYYVAVVLQRLDHWLALTIAELTVAYAFILSLLSDIQPAERFRWLLYPTNIPLTRMTELTGLPFDQLSPTVRADNHLDEFGWLRVVVLSLALLLGTVLLVYAGRGGAPTERQTTVPAQRSDEEPSEPMLEAER